MRRRRVGVAELVAAVIFAGPQVWVFGAAANDHFEEYRSRELLLADVDLLQSSDVDSQKFNNANWNLRGRQRRGRHAECGAYEGSALNGAAAAALAAALA